MHRADKFSGALIVITHPGFGSGSATLVNKTNKLKSCCQFCYYLNHKIFLLIYLINRTHFSVLIHLKLECSSVAYKCCCGRKYKYQAIEKIVAVVPDVIQTGL